VPAEQAATQTLPDAIRENAAGPASASGDSGSVSQHSLRDQIEADRYLSSRAAMSRRHRGLRISRIVPPGAGD
jgi:hypothetical protein